MSGFGYNVLGFGANASSAAAGGASDDQFNRVSFLSHFDGANNGVNNAFDDGSANNYTVTAAGNITQGSFGPFARPDGEWSVSFDGTGDYLQAANSADWDLGTGNFTWECFAKIADITRTQWFFSVFTTNSGQNAWGLRLESNGTLNAYFSGDGGESVTTIGVAAASSGLTESEWHHIAVVKNGTGSNNIQIYVDGASKVTGTFGAIFDTNLPFRVGRQGNDTYAQYFLGQISNIRIIKGTALYTGNFTAPTSKLTAITNTKLLTCQSNRFLDNSASAHTITPYGNSAVTAFGPFLTSSVYDAAVNGASAYMDGSGDTLRATWTAADIINQNFTLEYWLYYTQTSGYGTVSIGDTPSGTGYIHLSFEASGGDVFSDDGDHSNSGPYVSGAIHGNCWNHLALVRSGTSLYIYVNGAKVGTKDNITTSYFSGQSDEFGIGYIANPILGYICDARIVTSAVYSGSTYTVPTAPLTAITNTKLLLNMADGQAIDQVAKSNIALEGNAVTSTAQKKIGTASFYSPGGDGDKGLINTSGSALLPAYNWTIEVWTYCTNSAANQVVFAQGLSGGGGRVALGIEGSVYLLQIGSAKPQHNARTLNQWVHLCATYDGTTAKLYIDGTLASSGSVSYTTATDQNLQAGIGNLGTGWDTSAYGKWYGYIDELRVSRFIRHTGNFTPDTEPFADKGQ